MKIAGSLLLLPIAFSLCACTTTLVNRRDLYSPAQGTGPYTRTYREMRVHEGSYGVATPYNHHGSSAAATEGLFGISHSNH